LFKMAVPFGTTVQKSRLSPLMWTCFTLTDKQLSFSNFFRGNITWHIYLDENRTKGDFQATGLDSH
jgi:hypothetical protein